MPAETHIPTALGGTKPSPDEPAPNRAMKDPAMPPNPRSSRETGPGPRPATAPLRPSGGREPAPDAIRGRGPVATAAGRACPGPDPGVRWEPCTREISPREILFFDPGVTDLDAHLAHLRPEVEPVLSGPSGPATPASVGAQAEYDPLPPPAGGEGRVRGAAGSLTSLPPPLTSSPPPLLSFPRKREPRACAPRLLRRH